MKPAPLLMFVTVIERMTALLIAEDDVDEGGHVHHVHGVVVIYIRVSVVERAGVLSQNVIDCGSDIVYVYLAIFVGIASQPDDDGETGLLVGASEFVGEFGGSHADLGDV